MANERHTSIQESLKKLMQEGCKYLHAAKKYRHRALRSDYSEFQEMLHIMDLYSRHQAVLKDDIGRLNETLSLQEDSYYDEDDYDYDYDNDEEVETEDDEETLSTDEEWVDRLDLAIRDRQNVLTKLELMLLLKLDLHGKRMMLELLDIRDLNDLLQNYCGRLVTVLKQITSAERCLKKVTWVANRFREDRKKLEEILVHIAEKQKFSRGACVNWNNIEAEE